MTDMDDATFPRGEDGQAQPLDAHQLAVGDWACMQWHGWPAASLEHASNTAGGAPRCPSCGYALWRVGRVSQRANGAPAVEFDPRDGGR